MLRQTISSSNLRSVGYDEETRILEIEFNLGAIYQYYDVPLLIYQGLINAVSHGVYFDLHIKKSGYRYKQIN